MMVMMMKEEGRGGSSPCDHGGWAAGMHSKAAAVGRVALLSSVFLFLFFLFLRSSSSTFFDRLLGSLALALQVGGSGSGGLA